MVVVQAILQQLITEHSVQSDYSPIILTNEFTTTKIIKQEKKQYRAREFKLFVSIYSWIEPRSVEIDLLYTETVVQHVHIYRRV